MPADSPRPAAVTLGVPTFTSTELHKQLDAVLGKGASGTVYSLRDFPGLAVKEILLDGLDQRSIDAARLELTTLPALSHPGILRYHQVIEDGNFIYIVMDRHDGTLECLLIEHKRKKTHVSNRLICSIARQIAGALAYLCSASGTDTKGEPFRGLVHRDLKPINILVAADGEQFILADFGLCKDALRSGSTVAGTKPYMAPETLVYNSTSPASDIWALGVIIYELVTLKRPNFLGDKEPRHVFTSGWKPDLSAVEDDSTRTILERIFVLDPKKRPAAGELAELLRVSDVSVVGMRLRSMMLEEALSKANARIASLEREFQTKSSDICALKNTITTQTAEIDSLKSELKTKSTKVDALEQQFTRAIEDLRGAGRQHKLEMEQHKKVLGEALKGANGEVASLRKDLEAKFGQIDAQSSKVAALEGELQTKSAETSFLKSTIAAQAAEMDALKSELKTKSTKVDTLEQQSTRAIEDLRGAGRQHKLEMDQHKKKLDEALKGANNKIASLEKELKTKSTRVDTLEQQLADTVKHLSRMNRFTPIQDSSWTPLMRAAVTGDVEMARRYLSDKNKKNSDGDTAYTLAARAGQGAILELLDPTDKNGVTALMRAAERGDVEAVRALIPLQKGKKMMGGVMINGWTMLEGTALMRAAVCGHAEVVELLVEHEGGMKDGWDYTALMGAADNGHAECVKLLLAREGGMQDGIGQTALMKAARASRLDCAELLLKKEGGVQDKNGCTALMQAADKGHADCASLLLEKEGGKQNKNGWTALIYAAWNGHPDCVKLLLEREGGMQKSDGWTALMQAAQNGHVDCVKLLAEREGGMQNKNGWTALMWAAWSGHTDCVKLLLEREGDMKTTRRWCGYLPGTAALDIARREGHTGIASILSK